MQAGEFKLLVQLDMEDLFTGQTLVTFGYHRPTDDIITKLKQQIDTNIETLYQVIAEQPGRGHYHVHDCNPTVKVGFICDLYHVIVFKKKRKKRRNRF